MTTTLARFSDLTDSGEPWLGPIPSHWQVRRNATLFAQRNETGFGHLPILEVSLRTGVRVRNFENSDRKQVMSDREKYKRAVAGDIAYNMMRMWQGAVGVAPVDGLISPAYVVARPLAGTNSSYYESLFRTPAYMKQVDNYSRGIVKDRNRLYWEDFKAMPSPVPPPHEQLLITRYLTHINNRVNRFIRAKRRLIELLEEEKQVVVYQAVTRGLDPDVKMKDSGVEWLGEVPEEWEVRRLKTLCAMQSGDSITSESIEESGSYPVYGGNGIRGYSEEFTHSGEFALIGRQGALCGNVHLVRGEFWASEHAVVATLDRKHDVDWFVFLLKAMNLNQYSIAAAQPGLSVERLMNLWAPVPPVAEQMRLAKHIKQTLAACSAVQSRATDHITLLNEYRTRLISDVVTGKLDVREAAAGLPDIEEDVDAGEEGDLEGVDELLEEEMG